MFYKVFTTLMFKRKWKILCRVQCPQIWQTQQDFIIPQSFSLRKTPQQIQKNVDNKFRKRLDIISDYYHAHLFWHSTSISCEGSRAGCQTWANWQAVRVPTGGIQLEHLLQHQQSLAFKIRQKCGVCWPGNKDRKLIGIDRNISLPFCHKSYKQRD